MKIRTISVFFIILACAWTGLIYYVCSSEQVAERNYVTQQAIAEARGSYNKDLVYRRWVTEHGGVYVKPSGDTPPNPYLSHIPDRDVKTTEGQNLTLVNPAYMTRQVHEIAPEQYGARGHITSLNVLNPINTPDSWEKEALVMFQQGLSEAVSETTLDGEPYLRFMKPMITEEGCLKCHGHQGYKVGDIRGGISVSIPMQDYLASYASFVREDLVNRGITLSVGLALIALSYLFFIRLKVRENRYLAAVETSEQKYREIFDESTIGIGLADPVTGILIDCNRTLLQMIGCRREDLIGKPQWILHTKEAPEAQFSETFISHRDINPNGYEETTLLHKSGELIPVEIKAKPVELDGKSLLLGFFRNLSEQKNAERELAENEQMFRAVINHQSDAIFLCPIENGTILPIVVVNDIAVERYGYTRDEFLQLTPAEFTENNPDIWKRISNVPNESERVFFKALHRKKAGGSFPVECSSRILDLHNKKYLLTVVRDISEQVEQDKDHQELLARLKNLSLQIPGMIYEFERAADGHYSIPFSSASIYKLFGLYPEQVKDSTEPLLEKIYPEDLPGTVQTIELSAAQLTPWRHEFRIVPKDGSPIWLEGHSIPHAHPDGRILWYGFVSDITQRKLDEQKYLELNQQLQHREKIETIGLLTSGIAHNFNNNLAVILGNADLARSKALTAEEREGLLQNIHTAARRASDLVSQIMKFSRKNDLQEDMIHLPDLLQEIQQLLKSTIPASVSVQLNLPEGSNAKVLKANAGKIQDIILNLCSNAVYAMQDHGQLAISLDYIHGDLLGEGAAKVPNDRCYACLKVADTGCGIQEDLLEKIFEPFFTTKTAENGTGLGLSTIKNTVEQYGGTLRVESRVGSGTTFRICLPVMSIDAIHSAPMEHLSISGNERILFVDDDPMVAKVGADMLKNLGYSVQKVEDSLDAYEIFTRDPDSFDLIITDYIMPSMTGVDLAMKIKDVRPEVPILLVSGYSEKINKMNIENYNISEYCYKPFDITELSIAVRNALTG